MDLVGKVLKDRYEFEELIGSGGMARVYRAKCRQLNRNVAIKVLRDELKDDREFVEKFKTEALAAASLTHPNIVSVFDSGEDEGTYYFVMEYVDGYTLKQYISRKGALDWKEACDITLGICAAIEQAHKNNIVHRDIKPHNIMLNSDGVVKVTDFGIARAVSSSTIVRGGSIIGSVHYFSPEQARGAASTFKSDIYSIGVVFYEMLTGRVPFDADDPFKVAKMQVEQMPIEPKRMMESVPASVNQVVMRALSKKPEERFNSATEMISAIKNAVSIANTYGDNNFPVIEHTEDFDHTTEIPVVITKDDKKVKKEKNKGENDKISKIYGIAIGVVIILAIILISVFSGNGKTYTVEKFVGMEYEKIVEKYKDSDMYKIVLEEEVFDEDFEEGIITSQVPEDGRQIKEKELPVTIKVVVSKGEGIKMKNYKGEDGIETEFALSNEGYDVEIKERNSDEVEKGLIIRTIPSAGSSLQKGDRIILYVSVGPEEEITDPDNPDEGDNPSQSGNEDNPSVTEPDPVNPPNPPSHNTDPYAGL